MREPRARSQAPHDATGEAPGGPPGETHVPPWTRVVLVGFMGSGKTTVGRLLARRLGWAFVDLDDAVEAKAGRSVAELFNERGEAGFRALEAEAGEAALASERTVLAPGGGWSLAPGRLDRLPPGTFTVWLEVSAETAVRRAGAHGRPRPLLAGPDPVTRARTLLAEREPIYAQARLHLDAERTAPRALARAIAEQMEPKP